MKGICPADMSPEGVGSDEMELLQCVYRQWAEQLKASR